MNIQFTAREFRLLLDMVYSGNWVLNSIRGDDRFDEYDMLQEKLFSLCQANGMGVLIEDYGDHAIPSRAYEEGGIHEAIADYEDAVFFDILAEEMARRDMEEEQVNPETNLDSLSMRMDAYLDEFEISGVDHLRVVGGRG